MRVGNKNNWNYESIEIKKKTKKTKHNRNWKIWKKGRIVKIFILGVGLLMRAFKRIGVKKTLTIKKNE